MSKNLLDKGKVYLPSDGSGVSVRVSSMITSYANRKGVGRDEVSNDEILTYLESWCRKNGFGRQWDLWIAEPELELGKK